MQELIEAIRKQCSRDVWQRAQQLSATATVTGKRTHNEELELRVVTRGGMASPLVCLSPKQLDWSCECDSEETACVHVAASVLWIEQARSRGEDIAGFDAPTAKLAYRMKNEHGMLRVDRFLRRGEALLPLQQRLTLLSAARCRRRSRAWRRPTSAMDLALGGMVSGKIPRPLMPRVLAALAECTDVAARRRGGHDRRAAAR